MNHDYIDENEVVDRYVMGALAPAEAEQFELHYLSCPRCLDRLALSEAEQRGFRRLARQEAEKVVVVRQLALFAWLGRVGRSRQAAVLVMALLVATLLPGGLAMRWADRRDREMRAEQERQSAGADRRAAEVAAALDESRRELERERRAHADVDAELARAREPRGNVPILFLAAERDASAGAAPTHRLRPSATPGWVVLVVEVDPPHPPAYRVVLRDAAGKELWRGEGLVPDERDALVLTLPTDLLAPGDCSLAVDALAPGGKPVAAGRFAFRVLPPA